jgi:Response regulators consisting of a CheY-like receiver domain and a winged-helix DNA-binding domain
MEKIFIIEDNKTIRSELAEFLNNNGYETIAIDSFSTVVEDVLKENPDCILLDLALPNIDGHFICQEIRKQSRCPIIVVTSRDNVMDELIALNYGADDFIGKPYNLQVLLARIKRNLLRGNSASENIMTYRGINLNLGNASIEYMNQQLELTKNELRIMSCLFENAGRIVSRDELMESMWNSSLFVDDNTLTVNMNRLRKKLTTINLEDLIQTKRALGYTLHDMG